MIELRWFRIHEYRDGAIEDSPMEWRVLKYRTLKYWVDSEEVAHFEPLSPQSNKWEDWQDVPMAEEQSPP